MSKKANSEGSVYKDKQGHWRNVIKLRKRKIVTGIRNRACDYFYE